MAPNKFATMLHFKTNRITFVLVYAFLEWVLILLLLLNSLFSYLIIKFAHYFGLKQPCLLCSRLDHIIEPHNPHSSYKQLICEHHAIELSSSAYCFTHHKLAESQHMCENCSFSHLHNHKHPSVMSVFRWLKEVGMVKSDADCLAVENGDDLDLRCSCCGATINRYVLSPAQMVNRNELLYPSDCDEEDDHNVLDSDLINEDDNSDGFSFWLPKGGYSMVDSDEEEDGEKAQNSYVSEFYIDLDDYQLVPVKMVNLETAKRDEDQNHDQVKDEMELNEQNVNVTATDVGDVYHEENDDTEVGKVLNEQSQDMELKREFVVEMELEETKMKEILSNKGDEEEIKIDFQVSKEIEVKYVDVPTSENDETKVEDLATKLGDELEIMELDTNKWHEEEKRVVDDAEFIHTNKNFQISSGDQANDVLITAIDDQVTEETELKSNIASSDFEDQTENRNITDKNEMVEPSIINVTTIEDEEEIKIDVQQNDEAKAKNMEIIELDNTELLNEKGDEEEKVVDDTEFIITNKQFQVSGDQAHDVLSTAFDDQVTEETESYQVISISASSELKQEAQEHNYIKVEIEEQELLYDSAFHRSVANELEIVIEELKCELNSERNALPALYVELEEERNAAAVSANQTLLMISKLQEEKATIEMEALQYQRMMEEQSVYDQEALQLMNEILVKREKELEICKKKISEYEGRDRIMLLKTRSCTKGNDEDSICRCDPNGHQEDSMDCFEEERLSILMQLKVLEAKLCTLSEEEKFNGDSNGQKPKQLLPLFDAAEIDSDDGLDSVLMISNSSPTNSESESKRVEIEEEVEHMYDRLHALEADKEFIKHCIGSLRKGDRGVHLLQEILQHLRDLKSLELQSRILYGLC